MGLNMKFTKMQGCGNDYVYVNGFTERVENKVQLAQKISNRNFGVGSDGLIFINPSKIADFEMEMYNADGSRSEMCGNGMRCVAYYVYAKGLIEKTSFTVESCGSIKYIDLVMQNGVCKAVRVDMGKPELRASLIPVQAVQEEVIGLPITVAGREWEMTCVSMGNPHAVVWANDCQELELEEIGPSFEHHSYFPNRTNTEFVKVIDRKTVEMRVWERGSGETLACGTGCCATAVACVLNNKTENEITVKVRGGEVEILWDQESGHIHMTGSAQIVFEGELVES